MPSRLIPRALFDFTFNIIPTSYHNYLSVYGSQMRR